jgi:DNA repair exonuclease SbcCD ATPase subunit
MITFKKLRYKNFLSTGNQFTEIVFDKNSFNTLVVGNNGAGKSTILDALTFSLFGKSYRGVSKSQLINSVNEKGTEVEIEFEIGTVKWKIVRCIKPNKFTIFKDDEILNQDAHANAQQIWLETVVLKMNYKSFTQIVILGSSNFVPFMQLSASNRREVIEDLLDIKIFSQMNSVLKDRTKIIKDEIRELEYKLMTLEEKYQMQESFMSEIEALGKKDISNKKKSIKELINQQEKLLEEEKDLEKSLESKNNELESFAGAREKLRKLGNLKGKITQKVTTITKEHKFFTDNVTCPTCTQSIEEEFRINKIKDSQNKAKELQSGYKELEEAIKEEELRESTFIKISDEVTNLTHGISQVNTKVSGFQKQVRDLEQEIQTLTTQLEDRNTENEKLANFKNQFEIATADADSRKDDIIRYNFVFDLLKDGGVKTKIIRKYLPLINQQVNRYLQMMDFYINFSLDEEFNESIKSPIHEDFSYSSFSEGEKMRIDLALLFTWREVAKIKNSLNCNLIIFDETFDSSLDGFGTDEFLRIIRFVVEKANIFVISHKEGLQDKFSNVIRFEKIKGFSRMVS